MSVGHILGSTNLNISLFDFMGNRLKASFGSALKFIDGRYPGHSLSMAMLTILVLVLAPSPKPLVEAVSSPALWTGLNERLLPSGKWFGLIGARGDVATAKQQGSSPITTGSIPAPSAPPASGSDASVPN